MINIKHIAIYIVIINSLITNLNIRAHDEHSMPGGRPDGHAPIDVMGGNKWK